MLALIVNRVIAPASKLATVRALNLETASSSLGDRLGLGEVAEREVYQALDWLLDQQERIETALAKRHLIGGTLALYDVSSSYLEGRCCELAKHGYSRDHRPDKLQIVYGLLCNREGCPVAIEVFESDTADPMTLGHQVLKLKKRFGLERVVVVGDRGMITSARIREEIAPAGLDWISALRAPQIHELVEGGPLQLSLFDERDLAEIASPDYPGERLIACRNPLLAAERARKRGELLAATERDLSRIKLAVDRKPNPLRAGSRSASNSAPRSIGTRWPSTMRSPSPTLASPGVARRTASPPRRASTASTSSAAACRKTPLAPKRLSAPTNPWPMSSGRSAP